MRHSRLSAILTALVTLLAAGMVPAAGASPKVVHTNAKVAMSYRVSDLTLLNDSIDVQAAKPHSTTAQRKLARAMGKDLYADYVTIARSQHVKPASYRDFGFDQVNTDPKDRPISIDGLLAQMMGQHCQLASQFRGVRYSTGIWPLVKKFWSLRNQALAARNQKPLTLPSPAKVCR